MLERFDAGLRPPNQQFSTKEPHEAPRESRLFSEMSTRSMKNNVNNSASPKPSTQAADFAQCEDVKRSLRRSDSGQEPITSYNKGV